MLPAQLCAALWACPALLWLGGGAGSSVPVWGDGNTANGQFCCTACKILFPQHLLGLLHYHLQHRCLPWSGEPCSGCWEGRVGVLSVPGPPELVVSGT